MKKKTESNQENLKNLLVSAYNDGLKNRENYENIKEKEENKKVEEIIRLVPEKVKRAGCDKEEYVLIMQMERHNYEEFCTLENHLNGNVVFVDCVPHLSQKVLDALPKDLTVREYTINGVPKKVFEYLKENNLNPEIIVKNFRMHMYGYDRDYYIALNMKNIKENLELKTLR